MKRDLSTPEARAAYARELRTIAGPLRWSGILFVLVGMALVAVHHTRMTQMPIAVPLAALGLGFLNLIAAITFRMRSR